MLLFGAAFLIFNVVSSFSIYQPSVFHKDSDDIGDHSEYDGYRLSVISTWHVSSVGDSSGFSIRNEYSITTFKNNEFGISNGDIADQESLNPLRDIDLILFGGQRCSSLNLFTLSAPLNRNIQAEVIMKRESLGQGVGLPFLLHGFQTVGFVSKSLSTAQKWMILFGGYSCLDGSSNDNIYALSLDTLKWTRLSIIGNHLDFSPGDIDSFDHSSGFIFTFMASSAHVFILEPDLENGAIRVTEIKSNCSYGCPLPGFGHSLTALSDNKLFLSGGVGLDGRVKDKSWLLSVSSNQTHSTWTPIRFKLISRDASFDKDFRLFQNAIHDKSRDLILLFGGFKVSDPKHSIISGSNSIPKLSDISVRNGTVFLTTTALQPVDEIWALDLNRKIGWIPALFNANNLLVSFATQVGNSFLVIDRPMLREGNSHNLSYQITKFDWKQEGAFPAASTAAEAPSTNGTGTVEIILITVFTILLVVTISVIGYRCYQRHQRLKEDWNAYDAEQRLDKLGGSSDASFADTGASMRKNTSELSPLELSPSSSEPKILSLSMPESRIMQLGKDYVVGKHISTSGEASIFKGKLLNREYIDYNSGIDTIAIKCSKKNTKMSNNFKQEIAIIWMFSSHKNFLNLVGYTENPPSMIMKYYDMGTLKDYICQRGPLKIPDKKWSPDLVLPMAIDVINGLREMHRSGLVHNDVKSSNVLLDRDKFGSVFAVLSDFGLTSIVDKSLLVVSGFEVSRTKGASIIYASPESILRYRHAKQPRSERTPKILKAGDIFSYGMILFELITRRTPWKEIKPKSRIEEAIVKGEIPRFKANKIIHTNIQSNQKWLDLVDLAKECWSFEPKERPTTDEVLESLNSISLMDPNTKTKPQVKMAESDSHSRI